MVRAISPRNVSTVDAVDICASVTTRHGVILSAYQNSRAAAGSKTSGDGRARNQQRRCEEQDAEQASRRLAAGSAHGRIMPEQPYLRWDTQRYRVVLDRRG